MQPWHECKSNIEEWVESAPETPSPPKKKRRKRSLYRTLSKTREAASVCLRKVERLTAVSISVICLQDVSSKSAMRYEWESNSLRRLDKITIFFEGCVSVKYTHWFATIFFPSFALFMQCCVILQASSIFLQLYFFIQRCVILQASSIIFQLYFYYRMLCNIARFPYFFVSYTFFSSNVVIPQASSIIFQVYFYNRMLCNIANFQYFLSVILFSSNVV